MLQAVDEYPRRLREWAAERVRLDRQDARIAYTRLMVAGLAGGVVLLALRGTLSGWWVTLPIAGLIPLLKTHDRVIRARTAATRLVSFYERGVARLEDRWAGSGDSGERFLDENHLYASDLDLFGHGSLFELLSLARTRAGGDTLAGWLKGPADRSTIQSRHAALEELRTALDLREALTLAGSDIRAGVHPDELIAWATAPGTAISARHRVIAAGLTVALPALVLIAWRADSLFALVVALILRAVYEQRWGRHLESVLQRADGAARELDVLRPALILLEREPFSSRSLCELQSSLREARIRGRASGKAWNASTAIQRLTRYAEMHDWGHNIFFTPIAAALMWNTHLAYAAERWRATYGHHLGIWLRIVGEFEALSSLAAYAFEHPEDPLPEFIDVPQAPGLSGIFDGEALGHPLLPTQQTVRNDVRLGGRTALLVVSGSNMSGKSTLLRTVGINAVLALAGAPVRARSLRLSPLAIGATLRIQDSLQQGRSRFFAEITRIRQIADAAAERPLLFLLDELFHGTNSHDRLVGAIGVLRALIDRGAIGLITTHDLALTAITVEVGARAANVHFEDSFDGAQMRFDYRMKPGPVTRSNALALMRAVGLDVQSSAGNTSESTEDAP